MRRIVSAVAIVAAALGLVWVVRLSRARDDAVSRAAGHPAPDAAKTLGRVGGALPDVLVDPRLLAEKSRRTLTIFSDGRPVKTYRMALGGEPVGDKERAGDGKTPEGEYYVCLKNAASPYHASLGLSYPGADDAERGVTSSLISRREQRAIDDAVRHYLRPPWGTALGGEIMVHGGGTASDWTQGCIALSDVDIAELFDRLPLGTPVEIRP